LPWPLPVIRLFSALPLPTTAASLSVRFSTWPAEAQIEVYGTQRCRCRAHSASKQVVQIVDDIGIVADSAEHEIGAISAVDGIIAADAVDGVMPPPPQLVGAIIAAGKLSRKLPVAMGCRPGRNRLLP
jgi:hypothetical protein